MTIVDQALPARARWIGAVLALAAMSVLPPRSAWAAGPCDIAYPSDTLVAWTRYRLRAGETLERRFGDRWQDVARFNRIDRRHARAGAVIRAPVRLDDARSFTPLPRVWPPASGSPKAILVDLSEQFLGAYEYGRLVFASPITSGDEENPTPSGEFQVVAFDRSHRSSRYLVEGTDIPYPMRFGLCFLVKPGGVSYWIHGRDLPGVPTSHGCIGLYDEPMQARVYRDPAKPILEDSRRLYEWALGDVPDPGGYRALRDGPKVWIVGKEPVPGRSQIGRSHSSAVKSSTVSPRAISVAAPPSHQTIGARPMET